MKHFAVIVDNDLDADVRVLKEIKMLQDLGFVVSVLCFGYTGETYSNHTFAVTRISISKKRKSILYALNNSFPFYRWLLRRHVKQFLKSHDFDFVYTHDLYMSKPVKKGIIASGKDVRLILDLHENYPIAYANYGWTNKGFRKYLAKPDKWKKLEGEYLSYPDGIVVLSENFKVDLRNRYPFLNNIPMLVLPNIPDLAIFNEPKSIERSDRVTFLYFGVIGVRRGLLEVLDAFIYLQKTKKRNDVKLLLIGPVDQSDRVLFNEKMEQLSSEMLEYIPWINIEDLTTYMAVSDVGLCPIYVNDQHESGIANKVFQYMYGSLPIIVSNCRPQRELVEKYEIGRVFTNEAELLSQIEWCADNPDEVSIMGEKSYDVLRNNYTLEAYTSQLKKFIDNF